MLAIRQKVSSALMKRARRSAKVQLEADFQLACTLLEANELFVAGEDVFHESTMSDLFEKWSDKPITELISFANDSMTVQLSEITQHVHDIDSGDVTLPPTIAKVPEGQLNATQMPAIGPSLHTNPTMSMEFQVQQLHSDVKDRTDAEVRELIQARCGYALWIGPSQAPTPSHRAGVYLRGSAAPGAVVGLFPGAAYNGEMRQKAIDKGHLANPDVDRIIVPRYDDTIIDVYGAKAKKNNPFAVAQHIRHPPPDVAPNCMRIQYDFIDADDDTSNCLPFPNHLRDYVPNDWGSHVNLAQAMFSMLEQGIFAKGMAVIATRPLLDEELFCDHRLNPAIPQPSWYLPRQTEADLRLWSSYTG